MSQAADNTAADYGGGSSGVRLTSFARRAFWIVAGATLLIFLLFFSQGYIRLSETGRRLLAIFIFSACIAVPSMLLVTWLTVRYSEKIPRLMPLAQILGFVCTGTAGTLAAESILWLIGLCPYGRFWIQFRADWPFSIVMTLAIGMSVATYETLRHKLQTAEIELRTRQVERERAYKLLAEAQLASLESSIHPHFLFNTLNSIAALIPTDPQRAEDTVGKLASLLRFSLNAQHAGLVPVAQELKVARNFLEIEKTRFGDRLRYDIVVPNALESFKIPPLSLQTLVGNSVKHVAAARIEGASIQVRGSMADDCISFEVVDDGPGFSLGEVTPGHGLGNLVARLELLFGGRGRLEVLRQQEKTVVRISFPAES